MGNSHSDATDNSAQSEQNKKDKPVAGNSANTARPNSFFTSLRSRDRSQAASVWTAASNGACASPESTSTQSSFLSTPPTQRMTRGDSQISAGANTSAPAQKQHAIQRMTSFDVVVSDNASVLHDSLPDNIAQEDNATDVVDQTFRSFVSDVLAQQSPDMGVTSSQNTSRDVDATASLLARHPAFKALLDGVKGCLVDERRRRLTAEDWAQLLTRELDAHITARVRAEDELQANRCLLRKLAADFERLKQGRDSTLEAQVHTQMRQASKDTEESQHLPYSSDEVKKNIQLELSKAVIREGSDLAVNAVVQTLVDKVCAHEARVQHKIASSHERSASIEHQTSTPAEDYSMALASQSTAASSDLASQSPTASSHLASQSPAASSDLASQSPAASSDLAFQSPVALAEVQQSCAMNESTSSADIGAIGTAGHTTRHQAACASDKRQCVSADTEVNNNQQLSQKAQCSLDANPSKDNEGLQQGGTSELQLKLHGGHTVSSTSIPYMDDVESAVEVKPASHCSTPSTQQSLNTPTIKPLNPTCGFSFDDILQANLDYLSSDDDIEVDLVPQKTTSDVKAIPKSVTTSTPKSKLSLFKTQSQKVDIDVTSSARFWDEKLSRVARDKVSDQKAELDDSALLNIHRTKLKWEELSSQHSGSGTGSGGASRDEFEADAATGGKKLSQKLLDSTFQRSLNDSTTVRKLSIEDIAEQPDIKQAAESWERRADDSTRAATAVQRRTVRLVSRSEEELETDIMSLDVSAESIANVASTKSKWEHLLRDDAADKKLKSSPGKRGTLSKATDFGSLRGKFELRNPNTSGQESSEC